MKRILVTGGTGFLGAALVRRLVSIGHEVRVLDNGFRSTPSRISDLQCEILQGDIRDPQTVFNAIEGMDTVIHLAAINGTEFFYTKPDLVLDVGVRGILNVIEGCKIKQVRDLIVASSSEVYQTPAQIPTDETASLSVPDVLNPRYSYGGAKIITELLVVNQCRNDFERAILFRPHNVYGPEMGWEHVVPQFTIRALDAIDKNPFGKVPFEIQGDGRETRAFVHINDMIDGILVLLDRGKHLNVYHVGNPEEVSIADLARKIFRFLGRDCELVSGKLQPGSCKRRCPNIDKIKALGFSPKINLDEGLPSIIEWYTDHARLKK